MATSADYLKKIGWGGIDPSDVYTYSRGIRLQRAGGGSGWIWVGGSPSCPPKWPGSYGPRDSTFKYKLWPTADYHFKGTTVGPREVRLADGTTWKYATADLADPNRFTNRQVKREVERRRKEHGRNRRLCSINLPGAWGPDPTRGRRRSSGRTRRGSRKARRPSGKRKAARKKRPRRSTAIRKGPTGRVR